MKSYHRCEVSRLPNDILSRVISLTSPKDACCCEAVCPEFKAAGRSNDVWEHFLPSNIISRFDDPLPVFASKKELFFHLSDHDTLIDNGTRTFSLDRRTGANIYMIGTKSIDITWANTEYWQTIPFRDSRFGEAAALVLVWWLEMHLGINVKELSPETMYGSYLVFKLDEDSDGLDVPQQTYVSLGNYKSRQDVCLQPEDDEMIPESGNIRIPSERRDGWMEMELGDIYVNRGDVGEIRMGLHENEKLFSKRGLIVQGVEVRPKKTAD